MPTTRSGNPEAVIRPLGRLPVTAFMLSPYPGRMESIVALIFIFGISLAYTYPVWMHPGSYINGPGDPLEHLSITWWLSRKLLSGHLAGLWSIPPYFYPEPLPLAMGDPQLGGTLLGLPVFAATQNAVAAYNFVLLAALPLSGIGMYLLGRQVSQSRCAALAATTVWMVGCWHAGQAVHQQILSVEGFALVLYSLHRYADTRHRRWLLVLFFAWVAQEFLSEYWGAFQILLIGPTGLLILCLAPRTPAKYIARAAATVALATVPWLVMQAPLALQGREHSDVAVRTFSADLADYLPQRDTLLWGTHGHAHMIGDRPSGEHELGPGLCALLMAAIPAGASLRAFIRHKGERGRSPGLPSAMCTAPYLFLVTASVLWSCGLTISFLGHPLLPGPHALFVQISGVKGIRVLARVGILANLGVAVLAGCGLALSLQRIARSRAARGAVTALLCVLIVGENVPIHGTRFTSSGPMVPVYRPVDHWLAAAPAGPVVFLPFTDDARREGGRMWRQTLFAKPMMNGAQTFYPRRYSDDEALLRQPAKKKALSRLLRLGIRYVVLETADPLARTVGPFSNEYRLVHADRDARVYELRAASRHAGLL